MLSKCGRAMRKWKEGWEDVEWNGMVTFLPRLERVSHGVIVKQVKVKLWDFHMYGLWVMGVAGHCKGFLCGGEAGLPSEAFLGKHFC